MLFLLLSARQGSVIWLLFPSAPRGRMFVFVATGPFAMLGASAIEEGLRRFLGALHGEQAQAFVARTPRTSERRDRSPSTSGGRRGPYHANSRRAFRAT